MFFKKWSRNTSCGLSSLPSIANLPPGEYREYFIDLIMSLLQQMLGMYSFWLAISTLVYKHVRHSKVWHGADMFLWKYNGKYRTANDICNLVQRLVRSELKWNIYRGSNWWLAKGCINVCVGCNICIHIWFISLYVCLIIYPHYIQHTKQYVRNSFAENDRHAGASGK